MKNSAGPRHRAPSRWCHLEDEQHREVVTVAQLLEGNQEQLSQHRPLWHRLFPFRCEHAGQPRRAAEVPQPRAPTD